MKYKAVIGLEVHVQLNTQRKMFAMEQTTYGAPPNTQTSPTTLAHPGTLPSLNREAVEYALKMGIACQSSITEENRFDRKSYCYPDLPKGFQITQHTTPICRGGFVTVDTTTGTKQIGLERIHLEEDTGKTLHPTEGDVILIDFNRAGQPLIEIVTKPDIVSPEEAGAFVAEVQRLVRYLGISDGHMEEGSLRCDANVSIMPEDSTVLGEKVELKNMNSLRHVRLSIMEEIRRQTALKAEGKAIVSQTRSYNPQTGKNEFQRNKETLSGYRYIIEANLNPFVICQTDIKSMQATMPILPRELAHKLQTVYGLSARAVSVLVDEKETGLFFEAVCRYTKHYKVVANWIVGPIKYYLNYHKVHWCDFPLDAEKVAQLTNIVAEKMVSFSIASQKLFPQLIKNPDANPYQLAKEQQLNIGNTEQLHSWIHQTLENFPQKVVAYQSGKTSLLGFFMGEVMRISERKANPEKTRELLQKVLEELAPKE